MRSIVVMLQPVVLFLAVASCAMAGDAKTDDINIRIGFEKRNPDIEYVGWTACKDMEGGNAGDKGSELHLALAPRDYHLAIEYYEKDGPCALRTAEYYAHNLLVSFNGQTIATIIRHRTTGWSTWHVVIPKEMMTSSDKQVLRFVRRRGESIPIRHMRLTTSAPWQRIGWNAMVMQHFMHAPVFHFTRADNAVLYRGTIGLRGEKAGLTHVVESKTPDIDMAGIWKKLPHTGDFSVYAEAIDAKGESIGQIDFGFTKKTPFMGPYRPAKSGYMESGAKAALWAESCKDEKITKFPALLRSSIARVLVTYAKFYPKRENTEQMLQAAIKHCDALINDSTAPDWVYANMPRTQRNANTLQISRTGMLGMVCLDLFEATKEKRFLDTAMCIADTLKRTQLKEGRWYFRVDPKTGKMQIDYTSDQIQPILLLDELIGKYQRKDLIETRDKAVKWVLENPCKTYRWQGQWDDLADSPPYANLEWYDTALFIEYLLGKATAENGYEEIAIELFHFIEDHFVDWQPSERSQRRDVRVKWWGVKAITPSVREQYWCYSPIDWHGAHYIRACLALHRYTKENIYLDKAKAIANTLTVIQHPEGFYPTWMYHIPSKENPDKMEIGEIFYNDIWANCTSYTGEMLMKLGAYLEIELKLQGPASTAVALRGQAVSIKQSDEGGRLSIPRLREYEILEIDVNRR